MSFLSRSFLAGAVAAVALAGAAAASDRPVFSGERAASGGGAASEGAAAVLPFIGTDAPTTADLAAAGVSLAPLGTLGDGLAPGSDVSAPEVILGWDSRMRGYTTAYPNRAIVLIERRIGTTWYQHCTGFMISSNTVATAGHCLHTGGSSGSFYRVRDLRVSPGADGTERPYGTCGVKRTHSVVGWTRNADRRYDYGAMRLDCTVGSRTGWFGFYYRDGRGFFVNQPAIISGYPGDKARQQWLSADKVRTPGHLRLLYYRMDTVGGHSGSPIWNDRDEALAPAGAWAYGIHTFGSSSGNINGGTRIAQPVFDNLVRWRNLE